MKRHVNYFFLGLAAFLAVFGMVFLAALSAPASLKFFGNTNYYLFHQLERLAIGVVACLIIIKIPLRFLKKAAPVLLIANLLLLMVVFMPVVGTKFLGAKRWISIGSNTFQPSEFLKITAVLFLAAWLADHVSDQRKKNWILAAKKGYHNLTKVFLPFWILLIVIGAILIKQPDISTLGVTVAALLAVYFAAGTPLWHTLATFAIGAGAAVILVFTAPYRFQRLFTFLHPDKDPFGIGMQVKQSLIAIGSGGIFGKGLGMSTQKFGFLPQAMSDSIFPILGEETGILGTTIVLSAFVLLFWQGFKIAAASTDMFSRLAATGITMWLAVQTFISIACSVGFFPLSGIPLPFFSYGGSHIIAEMIGIGILLNISKNG